MQLDYVCCQCMEYDLVVYVYTLAYVLWCMKYDLYVGNAYNLCTLVYVPYNMRCIRDTTNGFFGVFPLLTHIYAY